MGLILEMSIVFLGCTFYLCWLPEFRITTFRQLVQVLLKQFTKQLFPPPSTPHPEFL